MKKVIIGGAGFVLAALALRRFGPALHKVAMNKCEEMFDGMPDDFPPKRMMRGIEDVREQNSRILRHLEEDQTALAAVSEGR